jgi:hypothetical protein
MRDLDILGLLRKYEPFDDLKRQAADEIERLRENFGSLYSRHIGDLHEATNLRDEIDRLIDLVDALSLALKPLGRGAPHAWLGDLEAVHRPAIDFALAELEAWEDDRQRLHEPKEARDA